MKIKRKQRCKKCIYYHEENNTCKSKKCSSNGGYGYVTLWDRLWCRANNVERRKSK